MATHSSVLAWRIPEMGEPAGLPSMGLHRVGHEGRDLAAAARSQEAVEPGNMICSPAGTQVFFSSSIWNARCALLTLQGQEVPIGYVYCVPLVRTKSQETEGCWAVHLNIDTS